MSRTKINKNRLRNTFVETVNFKEPDASGNVLITQVATAENLVSPDNINDTAYILFRTAGGTKSISDGPATLMKIAGNIVISSYFRIGVSAAYNPSEAFLGSIDLNNSYIKSKNNYSMKGYLTDNDRLIATNKGWGITE